MDFPFPLESSKLCFTAEAKVITMSDVVLNAGKINI